VHWLGIAFFAGAGIVVVRWLANRTDGLGRRRPFPLFWTVALIVLGCASLTPFVLRYRLENRLSAAATTMAGFDVEVYCQSFGEAFVDAGAEAGFVRFGPDGVPERSTLIKRQQCRDLSSYLRSSKDAPSEPHAVAVHTLTHETIHMTGIANEGVTECHAVQRDAEMARLLGASPEGGRALAAIYWNRFYPRMPDGYRSEECGPGGGLDLGGPDVPWRGS